MRQPGTSTAPPLLPWTVDVLETFTRSGGRPKDNLTPVVPFRAPLLYHPNARIKRIRILSEYTFEIEPSTTRPTNKRVWNFDDVLFAISVSHPFEEDNNVHLDEGTTTNRSPIVHKVPNHLDRNHVTKQAMERFVDISSYPP